MFVDNAQFLKLFSEFCLENFLKQVFKTAIIIFQDRVFGRQIDGPFARHAVIQRRPCKVADGVVEIVHRKRDAG